MKNENVVQSEATNETPKLGKSTHDKHCFIVMPYGRSPSEIRWFKGWYDVVIKLSVAGCGYEPKLSSAEEQPSAINDEIRTHLTYDPMVVVDLGGATFDADPNPNVMYELGIRHALGLPLVMMAWKGQKLPFDVGNQRVIMEGRELLDLETNRQKLVNFIKAAEAGHFYKPMDAVGRVAAIEAASATLGRDDLLRALAQEVHELKGTIAVSSISKYQRFARPLVPTIKTLIRTKEFRKDLYPLFVTSGGKPSHWSRFIKAQLPPEEIEKVSEWDEQEWKSYVIEQAKQFAEIELRSTLNSENVRPATVIRGKIELPREDEGGTVVGTSDDSVTLE